MKYVKIIGDTHSQALQKLRDTYGSDAMVYSEQEIPARSYTKRMLGKKEYEIWAAIFEKKKNSGNVKQQLNDLQKMISSVGSSASLKNTNNDESPSLQKVLSPRVDLQTSLREKEINPLANDNYNTEQQKSKNSALSGQEFLTVLQKEFGKTKPTDVIQVQEGASLQDLAKDIHFIKEHLSSFSQSSSPSFAEKEFENLFQYLCEQEFSESWAKKFTEQVQNDLAKNLWNDRKKIYQTAVAHLEKKVPVASSGGKKVLALVGPTGVGKTTTLAKLSARMQLQENKQVSLVTLDNYRIAATEQLRLFANIIEIPVYVFKEGEKFKAFVENDNSDIILVDTTGFSHYNKNFLLEQKEFFGGKTEKKIEKHLVLSATTRARDARLILQHFHEQKIDKLILTKLDESSCYGNFVELANDFSLPFSYFTTGQEVSKDHLQADSEFLAQKILQDFV